MDLLADLRRAREGDLVDHRMTHDRAAGGLTEAGDDVHDAVGQPRFEQQLAEAERGEGRLLGGLQHRRVAACERRAELPRGHQQREIPRDDLPADTDRLAQCEVEVRLVRRVRLAVDLAHPAGVVAERRRRRGDVDVAALHEGLAVVQGLELRELVGVRLDEIGDLQEEALALGRRDMGPAALVEGAARRAHGSLDVFGTSLRHARQHLACGGVRRLEGLPRRRLHPLPVDQHLPHRRGHEALDL